MIYILDRAEYTVGKGENPGYQHLLLYHNSFKIILLIHSLKHHFETVSNSKKLQTTSELLLLKDFKIQIAKKNIVEKGEIAHFEQFHLFPQCFPKGFLFNVLKLVHMEKRVKGSLRLGIVR